MNFPYEHKLVRQILGCTLVWVSEQLIGTVSYSEE